MVAETRYLLMAALWPVSNVFDQFSEEKYPRHKPVTIISSLNGSHSKKDKDWMSYGKWTILSPAEVAFPGQG